MSAPDGPPPPGHRAPPPPDDATGLPWPRTWRGVYALVVVWFGVTAGLLAWLSASSR